jgi:medium-chain acyl-[acyl-carrier-protein] hydrolase
VRLYCLPCAGRGASLYRNLTKRLASEVEIIALQIPGRETAMRKPLPVDLSQLAEQLSTQIDVTQPFGLYGHSMGGAIAWEMANILTDMGAPIEHVVIGACGPPHLTPPLPDEASMSDHDLLDWSASLGTVVPDGIDDTRMTELLEMLFTPLRSDIRMVMNHRSSYLTPLPVRLSVIAGIDDALASPSMMKDWERYTSTAFAIHMIDAGHIFVDELPFDEVLRSSVRLHV